MPTFINNLTSPSKVSIYSSVLIRKTSSSTSVVDFDEGNHEFNTEYYLFLTLCFSDLPSLSSITIPRTYEYLKIINREDFHQSIMFIIPILL